MPALREMQGLLGRALRAGRRRALFFTSGAARRHAHVGPPRLWEMKRRFQFEFLTSHGLRPSSRLLDIGCGTLRGGIPLIDYLQEGHYTGVEARAEVLEEARRELAEAGLEHKRPTLICSEDPAQVQLAEPVDVAWSFSVLFHMRDEIVDACFALVARSLSEHGVFYANVSLSDEREEQGRWQGFPVISRPREFYAQLAARHGLSIEDVGRLDALGHGAGPGEKSIMLRFARAGGEAGAGSAGSQRESS
ncbi:MAG TPA: class I SAM-dependent methyltransferase [Solirubrobacteraceae bacterium]|nr:class I SAM-dependent methyltransferase [Solirubrobacteraceae bacterium]